MEEGHAKVKQSILLLDAPQATAHMEKGGHVKVKQTILLLETAQMENIVRAKRAAHQGIVGV